MNGDQIVQLLWSLVAFALVGSSLLARRLNAGTIVKGILAWAAIFGVAFVLFSFRHQFEPFIRQIKLAASGENGHIEGNTLHIPLGEDNHFWVRAKVNDVSIRFLIDTGASTTAISTATAEAAKVKIENDGFHVLVNTANGQVRANRVRLTKFEVGSIRANDMTAITADAFGQNNVLGMDFLSRLESWRVEKGYLILVP